MKKIDIGQALTIVANAGVIGGLIFVGYQLRQDREIAQVDSVQSTIDLQITASALRAEHPDLWLRGLADDTLTAEESVIFDTLAQAHLAYYLTSWFRNSRIGTEAFRNRWVREAALEIAKYPGLRKYWQRVVNRQAAADSSGSGSEWETSVSNEIERLDALGE